MTPKTLEPASHPKDRPAITNPASLEIPTIAVIGLGYVGLPLAIRAATRGFPVVGFDIDRRKIASIESGTVAYITPEEQADLRSASAFTATADATRLRDADVFIICVPTPVSDGYEPDLAPLEGACRIVAKALRRGNLVVVESTVNPGACEEVVLPILESSGLKVERDFYLAHCPERINPGDSKWAVGSIPRVIGGAGAASLEKARALYERLVDADILPLNTLKEAEAVKMVENAFRDINIAFVNELAMAFDRAGIDLVNVIRGASTKPFAFMPHFPGAGVGGHCIPVDPYYLIRYGEKNGFMHRFLITARAINNRMPHYTVSMLSKALRRKRKQLSRATIALLGVAYKRDVPDMRESPAEEIRDILEKRGAVVRVYDPHVPEHSTSDSLEDALQDADAALIATDHSEFRSLTPFHFMRSGVGIVIDGRNCLRKEDFLESGVHYSGIGRASI
jgi:UDP-N-acetyl-D-glucosamine dehydrogenase